MAGEHSFCKKEREIGEIHTKVARMEKVIFDGNGNEPLFTSVPKLAMNVAILNENVETNNTLTSGVLRFKDELEGERIGKAIASKRFQWLIGIGVTINLALLTLLVTLILTRL